jgi:REP element-mobilizing transposase RayT
VYHVLNRGNYRRAIFQADKTKKAFLGCLAEACQRTGWVVHAWCLMQNHYHLALTTPRANLADGMRWFQGTFAMRFNRFRAEHGHMYQGRYKGIHVDPAGGLGPLCHYIHLNPVAAGLVAGGDLGQWQWTDIHWLLEPRRRPAWYEPGPALAHAGGLVDTVAGHAKYLEYLVWLAEDEPARRQMQFERMSIDWVIGTVDFAKVMLQEHRALARRPAEPGSSLLAASEVLWNETLDELLGKVGRERSDLSVTPKSAGWKLAVAAALKERTTVTSRWLGQHLVMGSRSHVSRKVSSWRRNPNPALARLVGLSALRTA